MQQSAVSDVVVKGIAPGMKVVIGWLLTVCVALGASGAQSDGERDAPSSIRSASRRFVVAAEDSADRMTLARWSDDIYRRFIEQWEPAPALPAERSFGIVVETSGGMSPGGGIVRRPVSSDSGDGYVLVIRDVAQLDAEAWVEAVCAMLLDALVQQAQPSEERGVFDESLPAWIAVGIAQNLYPVLRTRNQSLVVDQWRANQLPDPATVLSWEVLPPRRGFDKAFSGVWVAWLRQRVPDRAELLRHWVSLGADGWPIDADNLLPSAQAAMTDLGWEAYVASLQRLFSVDSQMGAALRYQRLREGMRVYPGIGGVPAALELSPDAGLDTLLAWRRDGWIRSFVRQRRAELAALIPGNDPGYQAMVNAVIDFINAVPGRRPQFLLRRDYAGLLLELDQEETLALAREQYLSLFEQRFGLGSMAESTVETRPFDRPRSRLRHYVDGFDTP